MSSYVAGKVLAGLSAFLAISLAACAGSASYGESALEGFPVQWTEEFSMPDLIEKPISVRSQEDLRSLLGRDWYAAIDVVSGDAKSVDTLTSCDDYFLAKGEPLQVENEQENAAFLELAVMCEATRLLVEATSSGHSTIPSQPLAEGLPDNLPKSMALVTSESEAQRIMSDPTINSWGDVHDIRAMERISEHRVIYHLDSGQQSLSTLGRGDFNGDGNEDLLLSVTRTVEGGSYFDLRLFALSKTESGNWVVNAHYPLE